MQQAEFLAVAAAELGAVLALDEARRAVERLAVPRVADAVALDVADEDGRFVRVGPATEGSGDGAASYRIPLEAGGKIVGALTLSSRARGLDPEERALADGLAPHVALAVERALRYADVEAAVKLREDVLAMASHDLAAPLQAILAAVQAGRAAAARGDAGIVAQQLDRVESAARRVMAMAGDLVGLGRVTAGGLAVVAERVPVTALVAGVLELVREEAAARSLTLVEDVESVGAHGDPDLLSRMLVNLVSNAVRLAPAGTRVTVRGRARMEDVEIVVEDEGPGIPAEEQARVFERWFTRRSGGSGLGLYIAKTIAEAHGGTIRVESAAAGAGTRFVVTLPAG